MVNIFLIAYGKYYIPKTLIAMLEFIDGARKGSVPKLIFNDTGDSNAHHSHCCTTKSL